MMTAPFPKSEGWCWIYGGFLMPVICLLWLLKYGKIAGSNPFRAAGFQWQTTSPPPTHNFHETPVVTQEPYSYENDTEEEMTVA